jgi:hypothetical protein
MSVEEMLRELTWLTSAMEHGEYTGDQLEESITDLSKKLHSLLISKLPEKKKLILVKEYSTPREYLPQKQEIKLNTNHQIIGYNSAIDDMHRVIDEMFRSGDE